MVSGPVQGKAEMTVEIVCLNVKITVSVDGLKLKFKWRVLVYVLVLFSGLDTYRLM